MPKYYAVTDQDKVYVGSRLRLCDCRTRKYKVWARLRHVDKSSLSGMCSVRIQDRMQAGSVPYMNIRIAHVKRSEAFRFFFLVVRYSVQLLAVTMYARTMTMSIISYHLVSSLVSSKIRCYVKKRCYVEPGHQYSGH